MSELFTQRCLNHATREAVARCPACGRFFCRECVTEHDDRMICAPCLRALARTPERTRARLARLARLGQCALGLLALWLFFYGVGRALLSIPSNFHEGTVWQQRWWEKE